MVTFLLLTSPVGHHSFQSNGQDIQYSESSMICALPASPTSPPFKDHLPMGSDSAVENNAVPGCTLVGQASACLHRAVMPIVPPVALCSSRKIQLRHPFLGERSLNHPQALKKILPWLLLCSQWHCAPTIWMLNLEGSDYLDRTVYGCQGLFQGWAMVCILAFLLHSPGPSTWPSMIDCPMRNEWISKIIHLVISCM